jgi:hypothetical protein
LGERRIGPLALRAHFSKQRQCHKDGEKSITIGDIISNYEYNSVNLQSSRRRVQEGMICRLLEQTPLVQARLSRRLEPVVSDPSTPGSPRCRGRNRDRDRFGRCIVVGLHARCSLVTLILSASQRCGPARLYGSGPSAESAESKSHLFSFDSDSDTDSDPD